MRILLFFFILPSVTFAGFSKPKLLARLSDRNAWNVPDNTWCFSGEPQAQGEKVYLNCFDAEGALMARWQEGAFSIAARAESENLFSRPVASFGKVSWYEFNEVSIPRTFVAGDLVEKIEIKNLSTYSDRVDSFIPYAPDKFFFKSAGDEPKLWSWKQDEVTPMFEPKSAYIFSPIVGASGEIVLKTRDLHLSENAPDRLWHFSGEWKVVLEDKDANPESKWKSFRHQLSVDGDQILLIANDGKRDHLILLQDGEEKILATEGVELKSFDYFSPKLRAGVIVVRGEDFQGNKAVYVYENEVYKKIISQGDTVQTDVGQGLVYYPSKDAIFYGAPGIDERGNVYLQATLSDADHPKTLLGIGLIKFHKE